MGKYIRRVSKETVEIHFEKANVSLEGLCTFFQSRNDERFCIATDSMGTKGVYVNEPDILTLEQEESILKETGLHVVTMCKSDIKSVSDVRKKVKVLRLFSWIGIILIILIVIGVIGFCMS